MGMTNDQKKILAKMKKVMKDTSVLEERGQHAKAIVVLKTNLNELTDYLKGMKKDDIPVELHEIQGKMSTELSKWNHQVKVNTKSNVKVDEVLDRMQDVMKEAEAHRGKGFHGKAIKHLQEGLKTITNVVGKMKKNDVPVPAKLHKMQAHMATELAKWKLEIKEGIGKSKTGVVERKVNQEILFRNSQANTIVAKFISALEVHEKDPSVRKLVAALRKDSISFKDNKMSFKEYKKSCMTLVESHQKNHYAMHHKQPKGVFEHIKDAVRAMMRVLEKIFNYVTSSKSVMFKKPDTELGKDTKAFTKALNELKEYEEPAPKNVVQHK